MIAKNTQEKFKVTLTLVSMTLMLIYIESVSLHSDNSHKPTSKAQETKKSHPSPRPLPVILNEKDKCEKANQIVFVKTHKTASSTVQNILLRFADTNNLSVGLPANSGSRFFYPRKFLKAMTKPNLDGSSPSIIAHHLRASDQLFESYPESKFVTILRSIPSLYESSFSYFKSETAPYRDAQNMTAFFNDPRKFIDSKDQVGPNGGRVFARNHMTYDLGFDHLSESDLDAEEAIKSMESRYELVMISDYFLESIVLLKHALCWNWEDVAFFVSNARAHKEVPDEELARKIEEWNHFDFKLFNHFNDTLWQKIQKLETFEEDKKTLEGILEKFKKRCLDSEVICKKGMSCGKSTKVAIKTNTLSETGSGDEVCKQMVLSEHEFTRKLFKKQWPNWTNFYG